MRFKLSFISNERIQEISNGEVLLPETYNLKNELLSPIHDGIMCQSIFGPMKDYTCGCGKIWNKSDIESICPKCKVEINKSSIRSNRMGHINLGVPLVHPLAIKWIALIIGISENSLKDVIYCKSAISIKNNKIMISNKTPENQNESTSIGVLNVLNQFKLSDNSSDTKKELMTNINKFFLYSILVSPPNFRPIQYINNILISDTKNELYLTILRRKIRLENMMRYNPHPLIIMTEIVQIQRSVDNLFINGITKNKIQYKSILDDLKGKHGLFRNNLLGKRTDFSGRSVISPDPDLVVDEINIPLLMAYELLCPFILNKLKLDVGSFKLARKLYKNKDDLAIETLYSIVDNHVILANRQPTLHKFGIRSFKIKIHTGKSIKLSPLICSAFNADFDGNCIDFETEVLLKLSKSILDKNSKVWYNMLKTETKCFSHNEEHIMKVSGSTEVLISRDEKVVTIKVGKVPKYGTPTKDKNGADVYPLPEGVSILSYDHKTGNKIWSPITSFTEEFDCPSVTVATATQEVIISNNESLTLFDHNTGKIGKKCPINSEGHFTPVINCVGTYGTIGDYNYGWWLGSFLSDGWLTMGKMIGYAKKEQIKRDLFVKIARKQLHENFTATTYEGKGMDCDYKYADSIKVHLRGVDLAKVVNSLNLTSPSSDNERQAIKKTIPNTLLNELSENALWGLFAGLIDGDGSCVKNTTYKNPRYNFKFSTSSPSLRDSVTKLAYRLGIRSTITTTPPRNKSKEAYTVIFSTIDMKLQSVGKLNFIGERENRIYKEFMGTKSNFNNSKDILPLTFIEVSWLKKVSRLLKENGFYTALSKKTNAQYPKVNLYKIRDILIKIEKTNKTNFLLINNFNDDLYDNLYKRVFTKDVRWEIIKTVTDAGKRNVYDFEVQNTKIFATGNGLIVWDTMAVHVPVSKPAVNECRKILNPLSNVLNDVNGITTIYPTHEILMGLYEMTTMKNCGDNLQKFKSLINPTYLYQIDKIKINEKIRLFKNNKYITTCVGREIISDILGIEIAESLTKYNIKKYINMSYKTLSKKRFADALLKITRLGFEIATKNAISLCIDDFKIPKNKHKLFNKAKLYSEKIEKSDVSKNKSYENIVRNWMLTIKTLQNDFINENDNSDNPLAIMLKIGARASMDQVSQLIVSKGMLANSVGHIIQNPIEHNYKEGLNQIEYFNSTYGSRKGLIDAKFGTQLSGYLARKLVSVAREIYISSKKCNCSSGIWVNKNELNGRIILEKNKDKYKVRSLIFCDNKAGVCSASYGIDPSTGKYAVIGKAVGIIAAQVLSEPTTQMALRNFHTSGAAALGESPKTIKSSTCGIAKIEESDVFNNVYIGDKKYIVNKHAELLIKNGDEIKQNDKIANYTKTDLGQEDVISKLPNLEIYYEMLKPKIKAVIATKFGRVSLVTDNEKINFLMNGEEIGCTVDQPVFIHDGQYVNKGDFLSYGEANLKNLYSDTMDLELIATVFVNRLFKLYDEEGVKINKIHLETIFRGLTTIVKKDNGKLGIRPMDDGEIILMGATEVSRNFPSWLKSAGFGWVKDSLSNAAPFDNISYDLPSERIMTGELLQRKNKPHRIYVNGK